VTKRKVQNDVVLLLDIKKTWVYNGVARVPCALGQNYSCAPCQQKVQSLKWKIGEKCGRSKNRTLTVVTLLFFEGNKTHLALEKVTTRGSEENGGSGAEPPDPEAIFTVFFFLKKNHF